MTVSSHLATTLALTLVLALVADARLDFGSGVDALHGNVASAMTLGAVAGKPHAITVSTNLPSTTLIFVHGAFSKSVVVVRDCTRSQAIL